MVTFKQNNKGITLTCTIKKASDNSVVTITGYTPKLQIKNRSTGATAEVTGTVTDGSNGICTFDIGTSITGTVGVYDAEVQLSQSTTYLEDSISFIVEIIPALV